MCRLLCVTGIIFGEEFPIPHHERRVTGTPKRSRFNGFMWGLQRHTGDGTESGSAQRQTNPKRFNRTSRGEIDYTVSSHNLCAVLKSRPIPLGD